MIQAVQNNLMRILETFPKFKNHIRRKIVFINEKLEEKDRKIKKEKSKY